MEGYHQVLGQIRRQIPNATVLLLGDSSHMQLADALLASQKSVNVVSLAGKMTLAELLGALSLCDTAVGPDTGPGHLCGMLNKPYVGLFGPTPPDRAAPHGSEDLAVKSPIGCAPCWRRKCPGLDRICMRTLSVDKIMDQLDQALSRE
jgi:ADP-heptose:LPS heptosyltransferase